MNFCIDIDNCIAQTDKVMREIIFQFTDGVVQLEYADIINFNYYECKDSNGNQISKLQWNSIHNIFSEPENLLRIEPMPGAVENIKRLSQIGLINIVTSRLPKGQEATKKWLLKYELNDFDLSFVKHGGKHLAFRQCDIAIEDDYNQAINFVQNKYTRCYLIKHTWNFPREQIDGIHWVTSWEELYENLIK